LVVAFWRHTAYRTHRRAQLSSCGVAGDIRSQLQKVGSAEDCACMLPNHTLSCAPCPCPLQPHNYRPRASLTAEAPQTSPQVDELAVQLKANQDSPIEHWLLQPSSISAQDVVLRLEPYLIGASELRGSASPAERRPVSGSASDLHAGLQRPARQSTASPTAATSPQLPVQQQPHEQVILQHNADEGGPLQHAMQLHHSTPARQPGGNTLPSASERISRKELASLIARATSLRQIQELHDRHQHMLDPLHVSAILSRVRRVNGEALCCQTCSACIMQAGRNAGHIAVIPSCTRLLCRQSPTSGLCCASPVAAVAKGRGAAWVITATPT
jgi:hypothetical protein